MNSNNDFFNDFCNDLDNHLSKISRQIIDTISCQNDIF